MAFDGNHRRGGEASRAGFTREPPGYLLARFSNKRTAA
jgi:hypothetical protein